MSTGYFILAVVIIVILCFPWMLKNDFMLIVLRPKENGKDLTFHRITSILFFPGCLSRDHCYNCTVNRASHHWSLLMSRASEAFFIRGRCVRVWACSLCHVPLRQAVYWRKRPPGASLKVLFMLKLLLFVWAACPESWTTLLLLNYSAQKSAISCIQAVICSWMISW